jgi:hypothetical protein
LTAAEFLKREARDYRTRAVASDDQGDGESARIFSIVALTLHEVAKALEAAALEEAA